MWKKVAQFLREVKVEIKKVVWPTRKELIASTTVVLLVTFIVATYLGLVDYLLSEAVKMLLH
jgi:preprotein translocase subunit SecE